MSLFSLKQPFGTDYSVNPDDVVNTKSALSQLGYYAPPDDIGIKPWTDDATFTGIKNFQKDNDLTVDGFMRPGGPTETTINKQLASAKTDEDWEYDGDLDKNGSKDVTTHGPVKVEIHNPGPGLSGLRYKVDWYGLDKDGKVIPEYRRPDHDERIREEPGHVWKSRTEKIYHPPFESPHGYNFRLNYPPQPEYTPFEGSPISKSTARRSRSPMRIKTILASVGIFGIVAASSYWVWKTQYDEQRPINMALLNKHMETFTPKYRREECLVRVAITESDTWSDALKDRIFRNLMRFVSEERPQLGPCSYLLKPATGQMFVQFADDCPNRFEHMRDWAKRYARRYDTPRFTVSTDTIKPGPDTLDHRDDLWID